MSHQTVPDWPRIEAVTRPDGSAEVVVDGASHPIETTSLEDARASIVTKVTETAVELGRPVRMTASGPDGVWPLVVHPDGSVQDDDTAPSPRAPRRAAAVPPAPAAPPEEPASPGAPTEAVSPTAPPPPTPAATPAPAPDPAPAPAHGPSGLPVLTSPTAPPPSAPVSLSSTLSSMSAPTPPRGVVSPAAAQQAPTQPASTSPSTAPETRRERRSFLTEEQREEPASQGVRGLLTRVGVRMSPSEAERAERADVQAVSQHWPGPRTIAVVNGKGGAGKTPTTVLLAAVFARYGGAGVLTWDNNQTRGTLGWRTEQGPHEATLLDLLPQVDRLLSTGAQSADLAHFVHHQTRDRFDVLRSKPMALAQDQRIEPEDVDAIHAVAAKYYRLIFIDSGNDESDPMWRRMIHHADQLVVATTTRDDHAEAGALLLEGLATVDAKAAALARDAVVVVSQADPKATTSDVQRVATGYGDLARETVTVPFDPAMVDGVLRHGSLRASTQRAWLAAGAAVARGL